MEEHICNSCNYQTADYRCNRLVSSGFYGNNDILGSDFKKGNKCPYYVEGRGRRKTKSLSLGYNS